MQEIIEYTIQDSWLNKLLIARTSKGICAIFMDDNPQILCTHLQNCFPIAKLIRADHALKKYAYRITNYMVNPQDNLNIPLDIRGTSFQKKVWNALREIPVGHRYSYSNIAKKLKKPQAFRAVANACAANVIAILIPCHRVVRSDGAISGYRWGVNRKRHLLALETAAKNLM